MPMLRNAKHEHFAQLLAKGESPPKAYVICGYSEHGAAQSANRLLKVADVAARIEELIKAVEQPSRERAIEKAAVNKAWVLQELVEVVKMAKAPELVLDNEGNPTGQCKQNLPAANQALGLIGKELGMFIDRAEVRTGPLDGLEHEELRQLHDAIRSLAANREPVAESAGSTRH